MLTHSAHSGADWFRRRVSLTPTDECVRYVLQIEKVPEQVAVYINGAFVGTVEGTRTGKLDVTESVYLGENTIALKLTKNSARSSGSFGCIELQPVPCE